MEYYELQSKMKPPYPKGTRHGQPKNRSTSTDKNILSTTRQSGRPIALEKRKQPRSELKDDFPSTSQTSQNLQIDVKPSLNHAFNMRLGCKGICGRENSCYLDVLLFSMFYTTRIFDNLLVEKFSDAEFARRTRYILREKIASQLREQPFYCPPEYVKYLRDHLAKLNDKFRRSLLALEDAVYMLFEQALEEPQFICYNGNQNGFMHVLLANHKDTEKRINIQKNFEYSMMANGHMKLVRVPSPVLIVSLPWHREQLSYYLSVAPVPELNIETTITDVYCRFCPKKAIWESSDSDRRPWDTERKPVYFCADCITLADDRLTYKNRKHMRLLAIICYNACHFTAFVRFNQQLENESDVWGSCKWMFFNSTTGEGPKVQDATSYILSFGNAKASPNCQTWTECFSHFYKIHSAHTCIYEPIFYNEKTRTEK